MKLEINKERILRSIQKAEKIASKNVTLPVLSCLLFEAKDGELNIKATNLDISIVISNKAKIEKDGIAAIPSQTISSYISNLPKSDTSVNFELRDNNLYINTKSSDTTIKTQSVDDFPQINKTSSDGQTRV